MFFFFFDSLDLKPVPLKLDADSVWRVGGTRVRLETIIYAFNSGLSPEEISLRYPSIGLDDVYSVISYYLSHRVSVDEYVASQQRQSDETEKELRAKFPTGVIRERLLARKCSKS